MRISDGFVSLSHFYIGPGFKLHTAPRGTLWVRVWGLVGSQLQLEMQRRWWLHVGNLSWDHIVRASFVDHWNSTAKANLPELGHVSPRVLASSHLVFVYSLPDTIMPSSKAP
jgi:hypothetical protein